MLVREDLRDYLKPKSVDDIKAQIETADVSYLIQAVTGSRFQNQSDEIQKLIYDKLVLELQANPDDNIEEIIRKSNGLPENIKTIIFQQIESIIKSGQLTPHTLSDIINYSDGYFNDLITPVYIEKYKEARKGWDINWLTLSVMVDSPKFVKLVMEDFNKEYLIWHALCIAGIYGTKNSLKYLLKTYPDAPIYDASKHEATPLMRLISGANPTRSDYKQFKECLKVIASDKNRMKQLWKDNEDLAMKVVELANK